MKKILVIRFSSIGDIVLTTPVIRCLKKQLPESEVHYLTKQQYYPLLKDNPYIDQHHCLQQRLWPLLRQLKKEKFDLIVDLHHNLRSFLVKNTLWVKSYSVNKLNFKKWLLVNLKWNLLPDKHIVDRYLETVTSLGIKNDGAGLDYFIPADERVNIDSLPRQHQNGYIAFGIGAKHATKQLPLNKMAQICRGLEKPVVLLGGEYDFHLGNQIANELGNKVYNRCGVYSINQSASLIQQAEQVITHDTGLMHIAAALDKHIISVWGNTVPDFGMTPYLGDKSDRQAHIMEVEDLPCRPCSKIGYQKCPKKHFYCMEGQDEEEIIQLANKKSYKEEPSHQ
jgi:ADP-heptose:LPS heptosyltransferase